MLELNTKVGRVLPVSLPQLAAPATSASSIPLSAGPKRSQNNGNVRSQLALPKAMPDMQSMIEEVYRTELGRLPDGVGLRDWGTMIQRMHGGGSSPGAIKQALLDGVRGSAEFIEKNPTQDPGPAAGGPIPDVADGTYGGQCVVFVEKQTGHYFPVEGAKEMLNPGKHPGYNVVQTPQPGDVFVNTNGRWGHTGIVKSVNPDGSLVVIDSNSNLDEKVRTHTIPAGDAAGYLRRDPSQAPTPYGR
jgi:surface antigen